METLVTRTFDLSKQMCGAAGVSLYTVALVADRRDRNRILTIREGWAGLEPKEESYAPVEAAVKTFELLVAPDSPFTMTPTGHPLTDKWLHRGGVRRQVDDDHLLTVGSGWLDQCDAQHALVLSYEMSWPIRLHHVGFSHRTRVGMMSAVRNDEQLFSNQAVHCPETDHERYFVWAGEYDCWREHQYFPEAKNTAGKVVYRVHWDFIDPIGELLRFVAGHMGSLRYEFEATPNGPTGVTTEINRYHVEHAIMARPHDWDPIKG
jgi:hypothetical protein